MNAHFPNQGIFVQIKHFNVVLILLAKDLKGPCNIDSKIEKNSQILY